MKKNGTLLQIMALLLCILFFGCAAGVRPDAAAETAVPQGTENVPTVTSAPDPAAAADPVTPSPTAEPGPSKPPLVIYTFAIGKADCILLTDGTHRIMIDTGEKDNAKAILKYLKGLGITGLDLMVITHFDKDHMGGAKEILKEVPASLLILPDYEPDGKRLTKLLKIAEEDGILCERITEDRTLTFGDLQLLIMAARGEYTGSNDDDENEGDNDQSLVIRAVYGEGRALFMGDAEDLRTREVLSSGEELTAAVLKLPHHGRYHETSEELLDAAAPRVALITNSGKNPAEEDLIRLLIDRRIDARHTASGTIAVTMEYDGSILVQQWND